jgi:hypothetical protein
MYYFRRNVCNKPLITRFIEEACVLLHYNDIEFKKMIGEFILSSLDNESLTSLLRNIDIKASKLGISFIK